MGNTLEFRDYLSKKDKKKLAKKKKRKLAKKINNTYYLENKFKDTVDAELIRKLDYEYANNINSILDDDKFKDDDGDINIYEANEELDGYITGVLLALGFKKTEKRYENIPKLY